jgi:cation diffusion facilitator family transporter
VPHSARITHVAFLNIIVAVAVTGIKVLAYRATGSVALYSDALESIVNVITAIAAFAAVRIANQPPDRGHPFGHHKAEYFAAGLVGALIVVAAGVILKEAWDAWRHPRAIEALAVGLLLSTLATVVNGAWSWFLITRGRAWRSPAVTADGWHLLTDVATSVGVLVGLVLVLLTGWTVLDPLLAAGVAINILWAGWRITRESVGGLMDEAPTPEILAQIRRVVAGSAGGALQVHDLRTRTAGRAIFIEFHLVVPGAMSVTEAHDICDRIEMALESTIDGADVVIHVEPEGEAKAKGALNL